MNRASPEKDPEAPLDVRMKRVTAREMFRLAHGYLRETEPTSGPAPETVPFAVLPQLLACVRLDPESVRLYFDHVHPRRGWRTRSMQALLTTVAKRPALRGALLEGLASRALGGAFVYDPAPDFRHVDWSAVDVLLAEWQFVGVFSGRRRTVSHVLTHDKYERCFENEIAAREAFGAWVALPPALRVQETGVRGWTEPFVPNEAPVNERRDSFSEVQAMLCVAYAATGRETDAAAYVDQLARQADTFYDEGSPVGVLLRRLLASVREQVALGDLSTLPIARCHGDLGVGQVLTVGNEPAVIDWSESEPAVVFHDYVYNALWRHGWGDFSVLPDIPDLRVLRSGLREVLDRVPHCLAAGLVLAEVAVKQRVDYAEGRGTVKTWTRLADQYLQTSSAPSPPHAAAAPASTA